MTNKDKSLEKILVDYGRRLQRLSPEAQNSVQDAYEQALAQINNYIKEQMLSLMKEMEDKPYDHTPESMDLFNDLTKAINERFK